jgi:hypothetical protein
LIKWKIALFAYRHAKGQFFSSPDWLGNYTQPTFKEIGAQLKEGSPLMAANPSDILMTLRPIKGSNSEHSTARACKFLNAVCVGFQTFMDSGVHSVYTFHVDYCMRKFVCSKRFSECLALQDELRLGMNVFPRNLQPALAHMVLAGNRHERGREIAIFVTTTHQIFAERGLFSPRLMEFLGIDVTKVNRHENNFSFIVHTHNSSF